MQAPTTTGWVVTKVAKTTHTGDLNHIKLGGGHFTIYLTDPTGQPHKISAVTAAVGVTSKVAGVKKGNSLTEDKQEELNNRMFGGGNIDLKAVSDAERENLLKDLLKLINPFKTDPVKHEIYYLENPMMHGWFVDDKTLTPIPILKTFTLCGLNVFSIKAKGSLGVSVEASVDIYTFIAGHQFTPLFTSYYFTIISGEVPLLDLQRMIMNKGYSPSGFELSFVQYYCPFIGTESSGAIQNAWGWAKDMHEANKIIAKKLRKSWDSVFPYIPESERPPMISPDK